MSTTSDNMNASAVLDKDEFVVHSKHTCDKCYKKPIVGKRFCSSTVSNYDLCANCFGSYDGPELGLKEVVLARDKHTKNSFVLKLKIDQLEDAQSQTRRVTVASMWDPLTSLLSYEKLIATAASFAYPSDKVEVSAEAFLTNAKTTYLDEDGDRITISSNEELTDAFRQTFNKSTLKPFRITVTIPRQTKKPITAVCARAPPFGIARTSPVPRVVRAKPVVKAAPAPTVIKISTKATGPKKEDPKQEQEKKEPHTPVKEEEIFIHARHTCDNCAKTPIVGTRYHATKIPDFDLCETCFKEYKGEDGDFVPTVLDRDRPMQIRWQRRWQRKDRVNNFAKKMHERRQALAESRAAAAAAAAAAPTAPSAAASAPSVSSNDDKPTEPKVDESEKQEEPEITVTPFEIPAENGDAVKEEEPAEATVAEEAPAEDKSSETGADSEVKSPETTPDAENKSPESSVKSQDDSFLSDADGNGSIAEVIGRTLDICVEAMDAITDEIKKDEAGSNSQSELQSTKSKRVTNPEDLGAAAAAVAVDALSLISGEKTDPEELSAAAKAVAADAISVASSMMSSMTDALKKMEELKTEPSVCDSIKASANQNTAESVSEAKEAPDTHSLVTGATILNSVGESKDKEVKESVAVDDGSDSEDGWSVVDDEKPKGENDDSFAHATEMIGSALFNSDMMSNGNDTLSPSVLARWDKELKQLREIGFVDDRKNIDALEHLEASQIGVDSTDEVSVNAAVEYLLRNAE